LGRPALPPRWSLGYLGSTMAYTDAPNAQEELRRFVDLCAGHDIPCDLFHLSSGYTLGADGKRYVFTWNRDRVPEPSAMTGYFHDAGIHVAANIKPCLLTTHPRYAEVAALGGFLQAATEDAPEVNIFWGGPGSHLDFTSPVAYGWWQENVRRQLLDYGIDSTWNDNNEYGVWDDDARCHGFGTPQRLSQLRPVQTLLMVRASWEAQVAAHPDERPFVLTRAGCPGVQRYAQTWSGDNATSWHTLRWNIPMGLGMGLSGLPNHGHDVGGFWGDAPDPELFLRWVQHGIFQPRFTIHSWRADGTANEPWMHPEVLPLVRAAMQFRYRLIPYLYTLLHQAAQTGAPITRPFVYAFPDDPAGHTESSISCSAPACWWRRSWSRSSGRARSTCPPANAGAISTPAPGRKAARRSPQQRPSATSRSLPRPAPCCRWATPCGMWARRRISARCSSSPIRRARGRRTGSRMTAILSPTSAAR
jgi:alpha-glucosidase